MKVKVKICGVRTLEDARAVLEAGADAIGLNFVPDSPRYVPSLKEAQVIAQFALSNGLLPVGVFADHSPGEVVERICAVKLRVVQVHGSESAAWGREIRKMLAAGSGAAPDAPKLWKAYRIATAADLSQIGTEAWPCDALLLDARAEGGVLGGTGQVFDWSLLDGVARKKEWVLAGGLNPANVAQAIRRIRPDWVDTASGVESAPGRKDPGKIKSFVEETQKAFV